MEYVNKCQTAVNSFAVRLLKSDFFQKESQFNLLLIESDFKCHDFCSSGYK